MSAGLALGMRRQLGLLAASRAGSSYPARRLVPQCRRQHAPAQPAQPVSNAADISHAHFLSSASPRSDFNPAQQPSAGVDRSPGGTWEGKLSPTKSHLFKLVLPLPDERWARAGAASGSGSTSQPAARPTAFLLHPSQPLSHLTRLIAGSLPAAHRRAEITFLALTGDEGDVDGHLRHAGDAGGAGAAHMTVSTTPGGGGADDAAAPGGADAGDGARDEGGPILSEREDRRGRWQEVAWSQSTDLSDFIKQACLGERFRIVIRPEREEGGEQQAGADELVLSVSIPTFASRTVYLRRRLLGLTRELDKMTRMKKDIDYKAHKSAQRLAVAALGGGVFYWGAVIRFTFFTDAGWDLMEPVTWATGFGALLCSAAFLVYHNREVSYSSLLDLSISARKRALYDKAGLDVERWSEMVAEAKQLRREISRIAADYDIEWRGELDVDEDGGGGGSDGRAADGDGDATRGDTTRSAARAGAGGFGGESTDGWAKATASASTGGGAPPAAQTASGHDELAPSDEGAGLNARDTVAGDDAGHSDERESQSAKPQSAKPQSGKNGKNGKSGKSGKSTIDIDKTIDEADALAEQSGERRAREKDAGRRGEAVDDGDEAEEGSGEAGQSRSGSGEKEGDAARRGRERARRLADEGVE